VKEPDELFRIDETGACFLAGRLLHPAHEPLEAARKDLAALPADARPADTLVLAGAGLGWHIRAALSRFSPEQIIVFPVTGKTWPDCLGPDLPPLAWVCDRQEMAEALGRRLVYNKEPGRLALYVHPAYAAAFPRLEEQVRAMLEDARNRGQSDHLTRRRLGGLWSRNMAANAARVFCLPDILHSAQAFKDVPALVLGAGPSLDLSLPDLSGAASKALLLGAASALSPLSQKGLALHAAVALEGMDESRQFAGGASACLLAALNSHPRHFALWPGIKAFFHSSAWLPHLLNWGGPLPSGGHATSAAFSLACLWGCNPIILAGQDLAYSQGERTHASARPGREDESLRRERLVPALDGGMVETSLVMHSYLQWYQEAAAHLRRRYPQVQIINATAAGAVIPGFTRLCLAEALASLPRRRENLGAETASLLSSLPLLAGEKAAPRLEEAYKLLNRSFSSYEDLLSLACSSLLSLWLQEEVSPDSWRQALAWARLVVQSLRREI
jgi:hypothetical protein